MVNQITVFLENEKGRLASLCRTLGEAGINMHALMVADTSEFGIVRIICDAPAKAARILEAAGYRASLTEVAAIEILDEPGGLAHVLQSLNDAGINVEYLYCFAHPNNDNSVAVMKIHGGDGVFETVGSVDYRALQAEDLYVPHEL